MLDDQRPAGGLRHPLARRPGRRHEVLQRRPRLLVAAGLQAAVRVDPQGPRRDVLEGPLEQLLDLLLGGHARGVDVPHARPDAPGEAGGLEVGQHLHPGPGRLDARDVGVQAVDRPHHLAELRVAQVGVDLGLVPHPRGGQAERVHRPAEVGGLVRAAQRQQLPQRRLVHLDDPDPGGLEVRDLVPQRERHLVRRLAERLVVAHEGPREDRHRASQHALDRLVGEGLGVADPRHRERLAAQARTLPADVAPQDRRAGAAGAVGLDPAVDGGREAVEVLGEVLDHVVALRLAVHQHVQAQLLLQPHDPLDLLPQEGVVLRVRQGAGAVPGAGGTDLGGLGEGSDRGGGQRGQGAGGREGPAVLGAPADLRGRPSDVRGGQRPGALAHGRVPDPCGVLPGAAGLGGLGQLRRDRLRPGGETAGQGDDLADLLVGEGEPAPQLRVQPGLLGHVVRDVEQGRGGGHGHLGAPAGQLRELVEPAGQVGPPHVVPVHGAGHEHGGVLAPEELQLLGGGGGALDEVEVQGLHPGAGQRVQQRPGGAVGRGDEQLRAPGHGGQARVGVPHGRGELLAGDVLVRHEGRLLQLHPVRAGGGELLEQPRVHGQQLGEPLQRVEARGGVVVGLGEEEEGHRAHEDRADGEAVRGGAADVGHEPVGGGAERGLRADLGHEVVVVGVEPLGQLEGSAPGVAAGQHEARVEAEPALGVGEIGEAGRHRPEGHGGVQDLVVEGERRGQGRVPGAEAQLHEPAVGRQLQVGGRRLELLAGRAPGPVGLQGLLQLAAAADPGVAGDGGGGERDSGHGGLLKRCRGVVRNGGWSRAQAGSRRSSSATGTCGTRGRSTCSSRSSAARCSLKV